MYICYCLERRGGTGALTYVGCTNNFTRRLRQHNGEIKGGARCTTRACAAGALWTPIHFAVGFIDKSQALSFEWWWKFKSRKLRGENKRKLAVEAVLALPKFQHIRYESPGATFTDPHA